MRETSLMREPWGSENVDVIATFIRKTMGIFYAGNL